MLNWIKDKLFPKSEKPLEKKRLILSEKHLLQLVRQGWTTESDTVIGYRKKSGCDIVLTNGNFDDLCDGKIVKTSGRELEAQLILQDIGWWVIEKIKQQNVCS